MSSLLAASSFLASLPPFVKDSAIQLHLLCLLLPVVSDLCFVSKLRPSDLWSLSLVLNLSSPHDFPFYPPAVCVLIYLQSINCIFSGFPLCIVSDLNNNLLWLPNFSSSLLSSSSCNFSISFVSFSFPILLTILIISLSPPATVNTCQFFISLAGDCGLLVVLLLNPCYIF